MINCMTGKHPAKNPDFAHQMIQIVEKSTSQGQLSTSLAPLLDPSAGKVNNRLICRAS